MKEVKDQEELADVIMQVRRDCYWQGYPTSDSVRSFMIPFGRQGEVHNRYAWVNAGVIVQYQGEPIAIRPQTFGSALIHALRPVGEFVFNGSAIVPEPARERVAREARAYRELHGAGFPTYDSRQELLPKKLMDEGVDDVLLTSAYPESTHVIDNLQYGFRNTVATLRHAARLVGRLHQDHHALWGDASLVNMAIRADDEMFLYNFSFKPNPKISRVAHESKDVIGLCISAVHRTQIPPRLLVRDMLEAYSPGDALKQELERETSSHESRAPLIRALLAPIEYIAFSDPVYGMKPALVEVIKQEIHSSLPYLGSSQAT